MFPERDSRAVSVSRTARIFISSTFRDFGDERDLLVRRVFPALRVRLKDRFVELVDVDLRWGITTEQAERGEVLQICLAEIDRSRPFFVGLLGERYGWVPNKGMYHPALVEQRPWLKKHKGVKSVTELEILHGVLNNPKMAGRALFYFRSSAYAKSKGGEYLPQDSENRRRQKDLKARLGKSGFPVVEGYKNPEVLAKRLERDLWNILDKIYPADVVPDAFAREGFRHEAYALPRRRLYLGGEGYIAALENALAQNKHRVLLEGVSGGGKSALIANWLDRRGKKDRRLVHVHYLAATAEASDPQTLVKRLAETIKRVTKSTLKILSEPQALYDSLSTWLAIAHDYAAKKKNKFLIVLDGLNGLRDLQDLSWFPDFLPERVQLVVSCLPGPVYEALQKKGNWQSVRVKPLNSQQAKELFVAYLRRYNKALSTDLLALAIAHPLSTNPLFLRTLAEELRLFGVHEQLKERLGHYLASRTVSDLFGRMLERVEGDCGARQVRKVMEAIWASRAGLSEGEIQGFASLLPAEWASIRHALDDSLLESGGRITFAHDYMRLAVSDRYLAGNKKVFDESQSLASIKLKKKAHIALAKWFVMGLNEERSRISRKVRTGKNTDPHTRPADARSAEEVPWQYKQAKDWKALKACLIRRDMFEAVYVNRGAEELLGYWLEVEANSRAKIEKEYEKALKVWKLKKRERATADLAGNISSFLQTAGRFKSRLIVSLAKIALQVEKYQIRTNSYRLSVRLNDLGFAFQSIGDLVSAERFYRRALALKINSKNRDPGNAITLNNLASLLYERGDYKNSEDLFRSALLLTEKTLGSMHPDTSNRLYNLASVLLGKDDNKNARALLYRALEISEKTEGSESSSVSLILAKLGSCHLSNGNDREAEKLMRRSHAIAEKVLGPSHPTTGARLDDLADVLSHRGDYNGAELIYRQALEVLEGALGKHHPRNASALNQIGKVLYHKGDYQGAVAYFRRGLDIATLAFGDSHPELSDYLNNIALVYDEEGERESAEVYYRRALEITELAWGSEHSSTAVSLNNLAVFLKRNEDYASAEPLYRRALALTEKIKGFRHPETAIRLNNLGLLLEAKGEYKKAESFLRDALSITEDSLGADHPDTGNRLNNLASVVHSLGRREEATSLFYRALAIFRGALDRDHPTLIACADNICFMHEENSEDDKAEVIYRAVLKSSGANSKSKNKNIATIRLSLGNLLRRNRRYAEAEKELLQAVSIGERIEFCEPFISLADLRIEQKRYSDAVKLLKRCLQIRRKKLNLSDSIIKDTVQKLAEVYHLMGRDNDAVAILKNLK